jgi:hypothetical protein
MLPRALCGVMKNQILSDASGLVLQRSFNLNNLGAKKTLVILVVSNLQRREVLQLNNSGKKNSRKKLRKKFVLLSHK